jgi:hypothetical protein
MRSPPWRIILLRLRYNCPFLYPLPRSRLQQFLCCRDYRDLRYYVTEVLLLTALHGFFWVHILILWATRHNIVYGTFVTACTGEHMVVKEGTKHGNCQLLSAKYIGKSEAKNNGDKLMWRKASNRRHVMEAATDISITWGALELQPSSKHWHTHSRWSSSS